MRRRRPQRRAAHAAAQICAGACGWRSRASRPARRASTQHASLSAQVLPPPPPRLRPGRAWRPWHTRPALSQPASLMCSALDATLPRKRALCLRVTRSLRRPHTGDGSSPPLPSALSHVAAQPVASCTAHVCRPCCSDDVPPTPVGPNHSPPPCAPRPAAWAAAYSPWACRMSPHPLVRCPLVVSWSWFRVAVCPVAPHPL